jgi:hypothetical protein
MLDATATDDLPDDVDALRALLLASRAQAAKLTATIRHHALQIEKLKLQLARLRRMQFGRSSEKLSQQIEQLELLIEELETPTAVPVTPAAAPAPEQPPARRALPAHLPRESIVHEPACRCPDCGGSLRDLGEAYPVSNGLWVYYDYQPLRVWNGTAPLTWNWLNACSMLTSTTLMLLALPQLKGMARLLLVPLAASGAYMGHMGAGFPMYNAMNTDWPAWVMELSGIASVLLTFVMVWLSSALLVKQQYQSFEP